MSITIFEYNGFKTVKEEEINFSNDLNCCIDVRDATLEMKLMRILILLHLKVKMKMCTIDVRISPYAGQRKYSVNILIIRDGDNEHYLNIRSISRLFHGSKYDKGMITVKNVIAHLGQLTN